MTFVKVWLAWAVFGLIVCSAALVWAVRAKQFTGLDRAGHIPLADLDSGEHQRARTPPSRSDRYGLAALLLCALAVVVSTISVGLAGR